MTDPATKVLVFSDILSDGERRYAVQLSDLQITYGAIYHQGEVIARLIDDTRDDDFLLWADAKDDWHFTDLWMEDPDAIV